MESKNLSHFLLAIFYQTNVRNWRHIQLLQNRTFNIYIYYIHYRNVDLFMRLSKMWLFTTLLTNSHSEQFCMSRTCSRNYISNITWRFFLKIFMTLLPNSCKCNAKYVILISKIFITNMNLYIMVVFVVLPLIYILI